MLDDIVIQMLVAYGARLFKDILCLVDLARNIGTAASIWMIDDHDLAMRIFELLGRN
jgi:hypothetical protein